MVVEGINLSSPAIEISATTYINTIPDVVTETTEIDTSEMESSYENSSTLLENVGLLLIVESRDEDQQSAVREELTTYISAAKLYLEAYAETLEYYTSETYKEDISKVETLDENLHANYNTFMEANNDLVETLDSYVDNEEETVEEVEETEES